MKNTIALLVPLLAVFALAACQSGAPVSSNAPAASSSEGDLDAKGFIESADGRLRVIGKGQLLISLKNMANPPAAPAGWELVGPVFDITAQDRQNRPVQKLAAQIKLRFDVPADRPVTVMVYNGSAWEIVPSESDADGKLVAEVEHLTPYVTASPASTQARAAPTAASKVTPNPKITVTTGTTSSGDAQTGLESAVAAVKGKKIKVTSAAGYTGSLYVALPGYLQTSLNAMSASGVTYYGLYNGVNEAITAQAKSGTASGALTLAVEPKTAFPASATDAKTSLAALFPGIPVSSLTQARADATTYIFYATSGGTAYSAGYVSYNGVTLAYGAVGTGSYQAFVPK